MKTKFLILILLLPCLTFGQTIESKRIADTAKMLTGTWQLHELKIDNQTKQIDGTSYLKLSFDENCQGQYETYKKYREPDTDRVIIESVTCQPVPELIYKNDKIVIHMTYMLGEEIEEIIELSEDFLILQSSNVKRTFKRIK